ncbi:MAG: hypothetical protein Kow0069_33120 [Promethearchaeota archaeon]
MPGPGGAGKTSLLQAVAFGPYGVAVNQQAFTSGSPRVPQVLATVTSAFPSSIVLLTWSVNGDVARTVAELAQAEKENENPGRIVVRREQAARRTAGGVDRVVVTTRDRLARFGARAPGSRGRAR